MQMQICVHFLKSGGSGIELLVRVLVAQYSTLRIQFVRFLLVAPIKLQVLLLVSISPARPQLSISK